MANYRRIRRIDCPEGKVVAESRARNSHGKQHGGASEGGLRAESDLIGGNWPL